MSKATERALEAAKRREANEKRKQARLTVLSSIDSAAAALRTAKSEKRYGDVRTCAQHIVAACDALEKLDAPAQDAGGKLAAE